MLSNQSFLKQFCLLVVPEKGLITSFLTHGGMLDDWGMWKLNYSLNPPSNFNAKIGFPSSMTLVQKHVVTNVPKFKPETFIPSSHGFCYFKNIKTQGNIFDACRQMRILYFITLVLRIFMAPVKIDH